MNEKTVVRVPANSHVPEWVMLEAEPESLEIDLQRTGVVIIDMQNGYATKGAYLELKGFDVAPARATIEPIKKISSAARAKGCKVIYLKKVIHYPGDAGTGPESVYWHKEGPLFMYREHPEWQDKLPLPGTWGAEIIKELAPQEGDVVVEKARYIGFFETNLETILKRYNIKYLLTVGVATNICVEGTIREAYHRGYFPILVSDGAAAMGPAFMQEAAIFNIKLHGWVTTSENVIKAMAQAQRR